MTPAPSAPPSLASPAALISLLKRRALTLGSAHTYDYALQFLLPVVLVRCLSAEDFGHYRLLWLTIMTVAGVASLSLPQSLYFFLPRSEPPVRRLYVHQTLLYMLAVGLLGGWAVSDWNPLQPGTIESLNRFGPLLPALVVFWVSGSLLDILPTIEERITWQSAATIGLATLRTLGLAAAAWLTNDLDVLLWLLLGLLVFKFLLLLRYIARGHGLGGSWLSRPSFAGQFRHAAPFGLSSALFALRAQADQWVVASLFAVHNFATFSIATVLWPLVNRFRQSVNHAFLPSMSRLHAADDMAGMLDLNSRANVLVGRMVYPLLAFTFVFADEMVNLVYTARYSEAAPVMRVYAFSVIALVVELGSITLLLREGVYALRVNLLALALSVALSWLGATHYGLPGAAAGSVLVLFLDRLFILRRIALRTGIPFAQLQDWRTLGLLLAFSALSGMLAWSAAGHFFTDSGPLVRMVAGGSVLASAYAALYGLFGSTGRGGLLAAIIQKE
ncbi:MAG TPA: oligosaccharide flippase family protein [Azonexus sp.]|nr:oligosaccharide flippase family protein [Azonexus sp.]